MGYKSAVKGLWVQSLVPEKQKQKPNTQMCLAALFLTAKETKQTKYPPIDEWSKQNVVQPHNGIFSSHKME